MYLISYHDFIYITTCIYKHLYNEHHNNLHKRHFKHDTNIHTDYIFLIIISQVVTSIKRYIDQSVSQYLILLFKVSQFEEKKCMKRYHKGHSCLGDHSWINTSIKSNMHGKMKYLGI